MDAPRFDALMRSLTPATPRRAMLAGLTGGLVAAGVPGLGIDVAEARKKRRKRKKKRKDAKPKTRIDASCAGLSGNSGMSIGSPDACLAQTFTALRSGQLVRAEVQISELSNRFRRFPAADRDGR